ncbi:MAG: OmpA family protein [Kofleriaceae bacterium]
MRPLIWSTLFVYACGHAPPSTELLSARAAYSEAADGPAKELVPDKLLEAKQALDAAEAKYDDDENSSTARALAYIAHRRTMIAVASAGVSTAHKDVELAERDYKELLEVSVKSSRDRLGKTEKNLEKTQTELERQEQELREKKTTLAGKEVELTKEKAARADAEDRLKAAMKSLEEIAKVKEDARGTIITLSGGVLFKTNESQLLPIAESQLRRVAEALNAYDQGRKIVVAGHTDSTGSASANARLSLNRAESVRGFLVQAGVGSDRISAVGKGSGEPVAENKTAEGRANNRRVEIIVGSAAK